MNNQTEYWKKLQDPRWQKKRLEVFQRDEFTCRLCRSKVNQLEVHHLYYISGREPWNYPLGAFKTLCSGCHKATRAADCKVVSNWERYCELENECQLKTDSEIPLAHLIYELAYFSRNTGWLVLWVINASLMEGLINRKSIERWINTLTKRNKAKGVIEK